MGKRKAFVIPAGCVAAGFGSGLQFWGLQDRGFRTEERGIVSLALRDMDGGQNGHGNIGNV